MRLLNASKSRVVIHSLLLSLFGVLYLCAPNKSHSTDTLTRPDGSCLRVEASDRSVVAHNDDGQSNTWLTVTAPWRIASLRVVAEAVFVFMVDHQQNVATIRIVDKNCNGSIESGELSPVLSHLISPPDDSGHPPYTIIAILYLLYALFDAGRWLRRWRRAAAASHGRHDAQPQATLAAPGGTRHRRNDRTPRQTRRRTRRQAPRDGA